MTTFMTKHVIRPVPCLTFYQSLIIFRVLFHSAILTCHYLLVSFKTLLSKDETV